MGKATDFGLKQYKKYGVDWHYKGVESGDIVRYNPTYSYWYWQKIPDNPKPITTKLTNMREYIVEYAYSSMIKIKCDTGRIVAYGSGYFEIKRNNEWIRL